MHLSGADSTTKKGGGKSHRLLWLQLMPCMPDWMTMYQVVKVLVKNPMKLMILHVQMWSQRRISVMSFQLSWPVTVLCVVWESVQRYHILLLMCLVSTQATDVRVRGYT